MKRVWEDLLTEVRSRAVTVGRILEVRLYTLRYWSFPAACLPSGQPKSEVFAEMSGPLLLAESGAASGQPEQPVTRSSEAEEKKSLLQPSDIPELANGGYRQSMDDHDRTLIAAALAQTDGNFTETARLIKLSRNGLKAKIKKLGLTALVAHARRPVAKNIGPRRRSSYGRHKLR